MVRNRKRKTDKGLHSKNDMQKAILMVESGMSLRKAADLNHVNFMTLQRYVKKKKDCSEEDIEHMRLTPNYASRMIFTESLENSLKEYLINCSKMCYGLDTIECRKLAYEMALFHKLNVPEKWHETRMAGVDWLYGFRKRNTDLTLRKPEPCSLTRATSFNRHNVNTFYDNLEAVMRRNPNFADGSRVYCLDETGTTTVQKPKKVIAAKGAKQLNKVTSAERGTLVTTCCAVSATGSPLPPAMVFPRKQFKSFMINGAPTGTLGLAQPTGWMNSELFPKVMQHFIKITSSSKENPSLFILDNHDSHLAPEVLNVAKDNGVTLLTIPPHTSHRLQPLDVSVFGPLQTYYNAAADSWMMRHPGQTISIYNVAELLGQAYDRAMTPSNIKSGFRKTGIFPFDCQIFTDDDFLSCEVTNRPQAGPQLAIPNEDTVLSTQHDRPQEASTSGVAAGPCNSIHGTASNQTTGVQSASISDTAGPSHLQAQENLSQNIDTRLSESPSLIDENSALFGMQLSLALHQSPVSVQPNEKTAAKNSSPAERPTQDDSLGNPSKIPVNVQPTKRTAEKKSLPAERLNQDDSLVSPIGCRAYPKAGPRLQSNRGRKRGRSCIATDTPIKNEFEQDALKRQMKNKRKQIVSEKQILKRPKRVKEVKRDLFADDDEELETDIENISISSSDEDDIPLSFKVTPKKDDFVIVKFVGKHQTKHFAGQLLTDIEGNEFDISYLRKSAKVDNSFHFPVEPDMATVPLEDIVASLPVLKVTNKTTKRQQDLYSFPKNIIKKFNMV